MSFSTFVGSLTVPASTGNKATTGVGFQPKVVYFWGNRRSADGASGSGSQNDDMSPFWGIGVSSTSRMAISQGDNFNSGPLASTTTKCLSQTSGSTLDFAADFVSMDADGFTVNFSTANATAYIVNFMALGGSDLTNVNLASFTASSSTGNQAVTGVGFKPDAIYLISLDTFGGSFGGIGFGMGVSSTSRGSMSFGYNGGASAGSYQRNDKVYALAQDDTITAREGDLVTLDSDGFTINWTTTQARTSTIFALSLKGGQYKVGSFTQKTSSGSQATTGVGFQPVGLFMHANGDTHATTINNSSGPYVLTGAVSGTTQRGAVVYHNGNFGTAVLDRTHLYVNYSDAATPTLVANADLTSFDSGGFTLNYGTADATAREVIYLAFGSAVASAFVPRNTYQAPILTQ